MIAYPSEFPAELVQSYWAEVQSLLANQHIFMPGSQIQLPASDRLKETIAKSAIGLFQKALREAGVGDSVYHSTPEETAHAITASGYLSKAYLKLQQFAERTLRAEPTRGRFSPALLQRRKGRKFYPSSGPSTPASGTVYKRKSKNICN